jgi:hypothetical protein
MLVVERERERGGRERRERGRRGRVQGTTDRRWDVDDRRRAGIGYLGTVVPYFSISYNSFNNKCRYNKVF